MNLFNKKLLQQRIQSFEFPTGEKRELSNKLITGWQKSLKDSDLEQTKEKSIQGKFLSTFLENILGYTDVTKGESEWSLIQHPRIENDSKEPDGSLGIFTKDLKLTKAVIELKDARAQLDKKQNRGTEKLTPIEQAYLYATKYDGCNWIIVSNFKEIRLYNKFKTQEYYEKFDVLELTGENEFKRFYYLLSKDNLISKEKESIIDLLIKDSTDNEQDITKKFYSDYKKVRLDLLQHLIINNPEIIDKELLLEKTQKLLDRFVFTMFCEDTSNLLPLNIVKNTYDRAINSLSPSDERVWTEFKGLFLAIDKGNNRVKPAINAYNGGLFSFDDVLDNLVIKDEIWTELMQLANYDFDTDLNVNILGHIFEQSISDLESLKSELSNQLIDNKTSKRKKDGIYYTPEYITRYIVENTVGKYLEENPDKLDSIKILDPACGSGAFLNQAHSYLLKEHKNRYETKLDEKLQKGENIGLFDYNPAEANRGILLNNLYGVDLNQESVEITKLALWLKTARSSEPLQNLDKNIKCGNSLIDDPEVAADKAFNWNSEYKEVIGDGGFDIIIGNPPYIFARNKNFNSIEKKYYYDKYHFTKYQINTYILFIEKSYKLLKDGGVLGFIIPNTWLTIDSFSNIREFILEKTSDIKILNIHDKVFHDANVDTSIVLFTKRPKGNIKLGEFKDNLLNIFGEFQKESFKTEKYIINISGIKNKESYGILRKIESVSTSLDSYTTVKSGFAAYEVGKGTPNQTVEMKNGRIYHSNSYNGKDWYKYLEGKDVKRYIIDWSGNYIKYGEWLSAPRNKMLYNSQRILVRQIPSQMPYTINAAFSNEDMLLSDRNSMIVSDFNKDVDPFYILGILNSKLISFWFINTFDKLQRNLFPQFKVNELARFPIPKTITSQTNLVDKVNKLMSLKISELESNLNILKFIKDQFRIEIKNKNFLGLGWNEIKDLILKQKITISVLELENLHKWYKDKQESLRLQEDILNNINKEIDQEVYNLYGLTAEEIKIIEDSIQTK